VTRGRPPAGPAFDRKVQCRAKSCRCQRKSVAGVTILTRPRSRGSRRTNAADISRSFDSNRGRLTCFRSIATSWRKPSNSTSFADERRRRRTCGCRKWDPRLEPFS
jgi:hypothetical protein